MANRPSVIDFDDVEEGNIASAQSNGHDNGGSGSFESLSGDANRPGYVNNGLFANAQETVAKAMWETGKSQASKAWSIYGNIDFLRPYFDVEPGDVMKRAVQALLPKVPTAVPIKVYNELYGPSMFTLTLIALLLYEMKASGHTVQEGTLIGTAFATCFGYWLGCGSMVYLLAYVCNTHITYLQMLSMIGYAQTSHCVVLLLSTIIHTAHQHIFFYVLWGVFGGLTTCRMMSILISRTHGPTQKLVICGVVAFLNLSYLLYLHFAYHQLVESIGDIVPANVRIITPQSVNSPQANINEDIPKIQEPAHVRIITPVSFKPKHKDIQI